MKITKKLEFTRKKLESYIKINSIIKGLEMKKNTTNNRDINSFIKSKNRVNKSVEVQAINNVYIDEQINNLKKWKEIIDSELDYLRKNEKYEYKIIFYKLIGYTYEKIIDETQVSQRILLKIWNEFVFEITVLAIQNNLI